MVKNRITAKSISSKKRWILIISIFVSLIISTLFVLSHSTIISKVFFVSPSPDIKMYNDWWIVGNSIEHVREKYGDFDRELYGAFNGNYGNHGGTVGYYIGTDENFLDPTHSKMYYWISYDSEKIITEVYINTLPGG